MRYDFDCCPDRHGTESIKWGAYSPEVLPLWVADMDFCSPEPVIRALQARVEHGVFGYPAGVDGRPQVQPDMTHVVMERMEQLYGWHIQPEAVLFVPGVVTGFNIACHALAEPGGGVVMQTPVYPPILAAAQYAGMVKQPVELARGPDGVYQVDYDAFAAAFTPATRLFILCNPHNPVGRVFRQDELACMAGICMQHKTVICSDEIHGDLIFSGQRQVPIASLDPEIEQNSITLLAPSKTFNIAGLEFSVAIIPNAELRRKYLAGKQGLVGGINLMGWVAARAAYLEGQEWLDQLLVYLEQNRDFLSDFVRQELPGVHMAKPEGTYLAWLDCREAGIPGNPYEFFLKEACVALNDGRTFGPGGEGFVRLNFGCPRSMLAEALARMRAALLRNLS